MVCSFSPRGFSDFANPWRVDGFQFQFLYALLDDLLSFPPLFAFLLRYQVPDVPDNLESLSVSGVGFP
jgi:hypothetical protein